MTKGVSKAPAKTVKKAAPVKKKSNANPYQLIENTCVTMLAKLQELELDYQLQSEINWCLGSFRNDGNPIGLYLMAERALVIFKAEYALKRKGVTAKLIGDIEKALTTR